MVATYGADGRDGLCGIANGLEAARSRLKCALLVLDDWAGDEAADAVSVVSEVADCLKIIWEEMDSLARVPEWPRVAIMPGLYARLADGCKTREEEKIEDTDEYLEACRGHVRNFVNAAAARALKGGLTIAKAEKEFGAMMDAGDGRPFVPAALKRSREDEWVCLARQ